MADTNVRRIRKDPRRGAILALPKEVADRLPEEVDVEVRLDEERGVIELVPFEVQRKPLKLK